MSSCTLAPEALGEGDGALEAVEVELEVDVWLAGYDAVSKLQDCTKLLTSTVTETNHLAKMVGPLCKISHHSNNRPGRLERHMLRKQVFVTASHGHYRYNEPPTLVVIFRVTGGSDAGHWTAYRHARCRDRLGIGCNRVNR